MPPRKRAPALLTNTADSGDAANASQQEQEPVKVSLYDGAGLRAALDECAREVVLKSGYSENTTPSNVRIITGSLAIGFAVYSQFGPGKFPGNWWMVFSCVVAYGILTTFLNFYSSRVEGDSFLICKPSKGDALGLRLASHLERYGDMYTLTASLGKKGEPGYREAQLCQSVTKFFHADGYLSKTAFEPQVTELLDKLARTESKKII